MPSAIRCAFYGAKIAGMRHPTAARRALARLQDFIGHGSYKMQTYIDFEDEDMAERGSNDEEGRLTSLLRLICLRCLALLQPECSRHAARFEVRSQGEAGPRARRWEPGRIECRYLILAKHSLSRSSSERTCDSMALCNATVPLLNNSPEAFLSKFSFQSRMACLTSLWACVVALV